MFIRSFFYEKYTHKHLSAHRKGFGRLSSFRSFGRTTSERLRYRIADVSQHISTKKQQNKTFQISQTLATIRFLKKSEHNTMI